MLTFDNLTLGYDRHLVIQHMCATIRAGELLALVGPNGAGKSTLLKSITGQIKPLQGKILYEGVTHREIAYLPQTININRSFPISVKQLVCTGLCSELGAMKAITGIHKERVEQALSVVGLNHLSMRPINTLSGGQFRRMLFARMLLQNAKVILLDEPFVGIDAKTVNDFVALLKQAQTGHRIIIVALHDIELISNYFPSTLILTQDYFAHGETLHILKKSNLFCDHQQLHLNRLLSKHKFDKPITME